MTNPFTTCYLLLFLGLALGCSRRPASVGIPDIDPDSAAAEAVEQLDADGDGKLSQDEATACPGIFEAFGKYDTDGDKFVSDEEIAARCRQWYGQGVGIFTVGCTVSLNGRPLPGAQVQLIPELFLSDVILPASGTTRDGGRTMLTIAPEDLPAELQGVRGIHAGLYRVEIRHPSQQLPAKYNTQSVLGRDVSLANQTTGLSFQLQAP